MLDIAGYQIHDKIYESGNSRVYRGQRVADGLHVILKILSEDYPTLEERTRYHREYEITRSLDSDGIIQAYDLINHKNTLVMIVENFGGKALNLWLDDGQRFTLEEFLTFAIKVAAIMTEIHKAKVIHKDINPANIVFNSKTGQVKIIDFSISTRLSQETPTLKNPDVLEGTLIYISPEQTGRMNRSLDYRTDFYSLGVTFYELLSDQLPFEAEDALGLIHQHIAKEPQPLHEIKPDIPPMVSDIVQKLMAKNAEDRYKSSYGLEADLLTCLHAWQAKQHIDPFPLGQKDISNTFKIPQKLYGREQEVKTLLAAFKRVNPEIGESESKDMKPELMLVAGYSGVGKTVLVKEVHKPITERRGFFIFGKYDQFQRNIPYSALSHAFNVFCDYLLTEDKTTLAQWRSRFLTALGRNGQVLIDIIPNLEYVIGQQPQVIQVGGLEAHNRFNRLFQNFVEVIAQSRHPLVIFIDDLQWADPASLSLLHMLLANDQTKHLLIIGAYRDNEVDSSHPLMTTLTAMKKDNINIHTLEVQNLLKRNVKDLLADTLQNPPNIEPLADLVYQKTYGNAFFVVEFLKSLYEEELLTFRIPTEYAQEKAHWFWDIEQIRHKNFTDNVVDLMAQKIGKLNPETQTLLKLAACIGHKFDLKTLSIILKDQQPQISGSANVLAGLWPAIEENLILPLDDNYKSLLVFHEGEEETETKDYKCQFLHDRVQQAAYSLIKDSEKEVVHLQIARLFLADTNALAVESTEDKLFDITNQFNQATSLITNEEEKIKVIILNLEAGKRVKQAAAYSVAVTYLNLGIKLLPENCWTICYDLTYDLYKELAEAAYLATDFETAENLYPLLLQNSVSNLDKVDIYLIQIEQLSQQARFAEAVNVTKLCLEILGIDLPQTEAELQTLFEAEYQAIPKYLGHRKITDLLHAPLMTDEKQKRLVKLLSNLHSNARLIGQSTLAFLASVKVVNICLQYGHTDMSPYAYIVGYSLVAGPRMNNYDDAYKFGQLAIELSHNFDNLVQRGRAYYGFAAFVNRWKKHLASGTPLFKEAYNFCVEGGDFTIAGYAITISLGFQIGYGRNLEKVKEEVDNFLPFLKRTNRRYLETVMKPLTLQPLLNLLGLTYAPNTFDNDTFNEERHLHAIKNVPPLQLGFYWFKMRSLYWFGFYQEALQFFDKISPMITTLVGFPGNWEIYFFTSLLLTAVYQEASIEDQVKYDELLETYQNAMKIWADHSPDNYHHKYLLVEAERARISDKFMDAMSLYKQAIASAHKYAYINNEALGNELYAKFWLAHHEREYAHIHLIRAHGLFRQWGATAKVKDLEEKYPHLLAQSTPQVEPLKSTRTSSSTRLGLVGSLDLETVMKAAQTISGEIVLDTLLSKIMKIIIENAGARKGHLLLQKDEQWAIEVTDMVEQGEQQQLALQTIPLSVAIQTSPPQLPETIINYVIRTSQYVVLDDAAHKGQFIKDTYITHHQPKSILCAPLINQGKLIGILYLENNITTAAFTQSRLEVLNLLSSQAAISIENASFYDTLEQSEKKYRTVFEDSKDTIFITTAAGHFVDINPIGLHIFGYTKDELYQLNARDFFVNPDDHLKFLQEIKAQGSTKDFEGKLRKKDGTQIDALMTAAIRQAEDGTILNYQGIIRDITARKRAELERLQLTAIQHDLTLARSIQESLLPPAKPDWPGLDVICYSAPARDVGGDFYAYHTFMPATMPASNASLESVAEKADKFAIAVGDVTGKGTPAALLMAVSLASFQAIVGQGLSPGELLVDLDQAIVPFTRTSYQNCAMVYVEIELSTLTMKAVNSGCITPLIRRVDGSVEWVDIGGVPLGIGFGAEVGYQEASLTLSAGDLVVLTSDGVAEANNAVEEMFGFERLAQTVKAGPAYNAEVMLTHVKDELSRFVGETEPHDDVTIVVIQV